MGTRETPASNHKEPPKVVVLWVQWGGIEQSSDFKHLTWLPCRRKLFRIVNFLFLCVAAPKIALSYVMKTAFLITEFRVSSHHNSQIVAAPWRSPWLRRHSKAYKMSEARISESRWAVQSWAWENTEDSYQSSEVNRNWGVDGRNKPARDWKCRASKTVGASTGKASPKRGPRSLSVVRMTRKTPRTSQRRGVLQIIHESPSPVSLDAGKWHSRHLIGKSRQILNCDSSTSFGA